MFKIVRQSGLRRARVFLNGMREGRFARIDFNCRKFVDPGCAASDAAYPEKEMKRVGGDAQELQRVSRPTPETLGSAVPRRTKCRHHVLFIGTHRALVQRSHLV